MKKPVTRLSWYQNSFDLMWGLFATALVHQIATSSTWAFLLVSWMCTPFCAARRNLTAMCPDNHPICQVITSKQLNSQFQKTWFSKEAGGMRYLGKLGWKSSYSDTAHATGHAAGLEQIGWVPWPSLPWWKRVGSHRSWVVPMEVDLTGVDGVDGVDTWFRFLGRCFPFFFDDEWPK